MTGSGVTAASMPGRWAAPPAPAMITRRPRPAACSPYAIISRGMRCAETTSASYATPNSASASAACSITGQSESEPMTTPTSGAVMRLRERWRPPRAPAGSRVLGVVAEQR